MKKIILLIEFVIILFISGCIDDRERLPPSVWCEDKDTGTIYWFECFNCDTIVDYCNDECNWSEDCKYNCMDINCSNYK